MRIPQRPILRALPSPPHRRFRALATMVSLGTVLAAGLLTITGGYAAASGASFGYSLSSSQVGQVATVTVSGSKAAEASLLVELRPPGNTWFDVSGACSGTAIGATSWSCSIAANGERPLGDHKVRFTEVVDGVASAVTTHFTVVPPPALAAPAPQPTVTPTPTPTPTPNPTRTPTPAPPSAPEPPQSPELLGAAPAPPVDTTIPLIVSAQPAGVELPTESLPEIADRVRSFAQVDQVDRNDPAAPSALSEGVPNVWRDPVRLLYAVGFAALFLLLVAIPAEVLNSTLEANAHRWRWMYAWALPIVKRVSGYISTLPAWGSSAPVVIVLTSIAFGFADPNFGFDLTSLRLVASLAVGLLLVVYLPSMITAALLGRRWHVPSAIITQPGAIIIAVLGVMASRVLEFSPGLLVGLVLGIELAASARAEDQRRAIVTRMLVTLGVAVSCWIAFTVISAALSGSDETFLSVFVLETLVAAVHEGITGLLVALLPLMFLDGKTLFDSSKLTWLALAGPTAIAFALLVLPTSDRLAADAPIVVWIGVFVGFSLTVAAVWAAFRALNLREQRAAASAGSDAPLEMDSSRT